MDKIFQKIIDNNFSDLKGTIVNATVPVPEYLINELIETALQGNRNIESCHVTIHPQNLVSANVKTTLLPWSVNLKLKLDRSVDFASFSAKSKGLVGKQHLAREIRVIFQCFARGCQTLWEPDRLGCWVVSSIS